MSCVTASSQCLEAQVDDDGAIDVDDLYLYHYLFFQEEDEEEEEAASSVGAESSFRLDHNEHSIVSRPSPINMVLIHTPSVYNHSCQWPNLPSVIATAVPSSSSSSSGVNSSVTTTSNLEWPPGTSHLFSAYDLFRCTVVLTITFGLIAGNIILALATNCKYSASVLQFQVCNKTVD